MRFEQVWGKITLLNLSSPTSSIEDCSSDDFHLARDFVTNRRSFTFKSSRFSLRHLLTSWDQMLFSWLASSEIVCQRLSSRSLTPDDNSESSWAERTTHMLHSFLSDMEDCLPSTSQYHSRHEDSVVCDVSGELLLFVYADKAQVLDPINVR